MSQTLKSQLSATSWLLLAGSLAFAPPPAKAQSNLGPVTVGAGLQTSFSHNSTTGTPSTDEFQLNSARIYISGPVTDQISFMFNTEFDGGTNKVGILDAAAQFNISPEIHIWAGRFLPPSDRSNLYGPYYSNQWGPYNDGVQDGYPFAYTGRDNGVMWWGDFQKLKVSLGAFDGKTTDGNRTVLGAARVQYDFWDKEEGYYLNGTYYGDKNILALGGATQFQSGNTATTLDFLLDRKLPNMGVVSVESEFSSYNGLGGYDGRYAKSVGAYGLAAYLFPKAVGKGKFQVLGKFAKADFSQGTLANYSQKTTEVNVNYVIKQFKARVMSFYQDLRYDAVRPNTYHVGLGLQIQM